MTRFQLNLNNNSSIIQKEQKVIKGNNSPDVRTDDNSKLDYKKTG